MPGIVTSDTSTSGAFDRAAARAASGLVKNLAENPFICKMAARVDGMTGSSSTTKICVAGSENTYVLFQIFFRESRSAAGGGNTRGRFESLGTALHRRV